MNEKTTSKCIAYFAIGLQIIIESDLVQPKHGIYAIVRNTLCSFSKRINIHFYPLAPNTICNFLLMLHETYGTL